MSAAGFRRALAVLAAGALCAGCAGGAEVTDPDDGTETPAASETPAATPPATVDAVPGDVLDEVLAAAAERAGVAPDEIEVVRAADVRWSSSALECPEEGQMYTQVVTDGYWVVLSADGQELDYRLADGGPVRLCEGGGDPPMEVVED